MPDKDRLLKYAEEYSARALRLVLSRETPPSIRRFAKPYFAQAEFTALQDALVRYSASCAAGGLTNEEQIILKLGRARG